MSFRKKITYFFRCTVSSFLLLIFVFNLIGNNLHELSEHLLHTELSCNAEKELDACHRFIFHNEKSDACNGLHKHYSAKHEECFSCKYIKERQNAFLVCSEIISPRPAELVSFNCKEKNSLPHTIVFHDLRGPPAFHS